MAKKKIENVAAEIRKLADEGKVTLGADTTVKGLQRGGIKKVFLSSNCDSRTQEAIQKLCMLADVECVELRQSNEEMGGMCRKPYSISVIGVTA